jgi:hypothetical protein
MRDNLAARHFPFGQATVVGESLRKNRLTQLRTFPAVTPVRKAGREAMCASRGIRMVKFATQNARRGRRDIKVAKAVPAFFPEEDA